LYFPLAQSAERRTLSFLPRIWYHYYMIRYNFIRRNPDEAIMRLSRSFLTDPTYDKFARLWQMHQRMMMHYPEWLIEAAVHWDTISEDEAEKLLEEIRIEEGLSQSRFLRERTRQEQQAFKQGWPYRVSQISETYLPRARHQKRYRKRQAREKVIQDYYREQRIIAETDDWIDDALSALSHAYTLDEIRRILDSWHGDPLYLPREVQETAQKRRWHLEPKVEYLRRT